jgi:D-alanyl-D-alanine carboxypeptidase
MNTRAIIRPARQEDLDDIAGQRRDSLRDIAHTAESRERLDAWLNLQHEERLPDFIADGCLLIAQSSRQTIASVALDLEASAFSELSVRPEWRHQGVGQRMLAAVERLAIRFGMTRLSTHSTEHAVDFYRTHGYTRQPGTAMADARGMGIDTLPLERAFPRRHTRYSREIKQLLESLGIPRDYGRRHRLMLQPECAELATIGVDTAGRESLMQPEAAMAWYAMHRAARADGIELQVVSAYRSVAYQAGIIRRKLEKGQSIAHILRVSAAPGFSEHHSGKAMDLTCPDSSPLEESFENTLAFEWLVDHALGHGFHMSFPRDNRHGIAFEPWHWAWAG